MNNMLFHDPQGKAWKWISTSSNEMIQVLLNSYDHMQRQENVQKPLTKLESVEDQISKICNTSINIGLNVRAQYPGDSDGIPNFSALCSTLMLDESSNATFILAHPFF